MKQRHPAMHCLTLYKTGQKDVRGQFAIIWRRGKTAFKTDAAALVLVDCKRGVSVVHGPIGAGASKENNKRFR